MAGLNAADILDVTIHGTLFGQQIITKFYYEVLNPSTAADTVTACTTFAGGWKAGAVSPFLAFLNCCPPEYNADVVSVQRIAPVRNRAGINNVNLPGTDGNSTNSTNQASVVTKATILSGRAQIGSWHIPGLAPANMLSGNVTNAFLALMSTFGSKCLNVFYDLTDGTTSARPCMYHRRKPPLAPVPTLGLYVTIPQRTVRTMRRRTIGIGK